jgi:hypothetical protein
VEADLTVDLPPAFYDARSNLRDLAAFRLAGAQLIQELLNIADFPIGGGGGGGTGDSESDKAEFWVKWLEKVHLERLLLRLVRMKKRNPKLFESRCKRLVKVITDLNASEEAKFKDLGMALGRATRVLMA